MKLGVLHSSDRRGTPRSSAKIAEIVLQAIAKQGNLESNSYAECLFDALKEYPPPFGMAWYGERYREYACDPYWLSISLVANSEVEADGAKKLWEISGQAPRHISGLIQRHSRDEVRHAHLYIAVLQHVFPTALEAKLRKDFLSRIPVYKTSDEPTENRELSTLQLLDKIIQINLGEIRTLIHQMLLEPMLLEYSKSASKPVVGRLLHSLRQDESRHIAYTSKIIKAYGDHGYKEFIWQTMHCRLAAFNEITLDQVSGLIIDGE